MLWHIHFLFHTYTINNAAESRYDYIKVHQALTLCFSLTHVQKLHFTLWRSNRLVGGSRAVVGCVGSCVSAIHWSVTRLAVARLWLAVWGGHWSVLVYIHPQYIPKSGYNCDKDMF